MSGGLQLPRHTMIISAKSGGGGGGSMKRLQHQTLKSLYVLHASVIAIVMVFADTREEGKGKEGELLRSSPIGCCNPRRAQ